MGVPPGAAGPAPRVAPLAARLAAFLLDLAVGLGMALVAVAAAWLWLLVVSDGGSHQPGDAAIFVALALGALWLPVWASYTFLAWTRSGQTLGLAAMALRVDDRRGRPPKPSRALARLLILSLAAPPLLLAPLLVVGAVAAGAQGTLPAVLAVAIALPVIAAAADPVCCAVTTERRALHDLAAGTRVVRAE